MEEEEDEAEALPPLEEEEEDEESPLLGTPSSPLTFGCVVQNAIGTKVLSRSTTPSFVSSVRTLSKGRRADLTAESDETSVETRDW